MPVTHAVTLNPWVFDAFMWTRMLVTEWIGLVGGALVAAGFLIYERVISKEPLSSKALVYGLWAMFIMSNFLAWHDESTQADNYMIQTVQAQATAAALQYQLNTESAPNLQASIQNAYVHDEGMTTVFYVVVDVRNLGGPSTADYWELCDKSYDGQLYYINLHRLDKPYYFRTGGGVMRYKPSYWLPDRTLPTPIPHGGDVKGILIGMVSIAQAGAIGGLDYNQLCVTFNDVNGTTHQGTEVKYSLNGPPVTPPTLDR